MEFERALWGATVELGDGPASPGERLASAASAYARAKRESRRRHEDLKAAMRAVVAASRPTKKAEAYGRMRELSILAEAARRDEEAAAKSLLSAAAASY